MELRSIALHPNDAFPLGFVKGAGKVTKENEGRDLLFREGLMSVATTVGVWSDFDRNCHPRFVCGR